MAHVEETDNPRKKIKLLEEELEKLQAELDKPSEEFSLNNKLRELNDIINTVKHELNEAGDKLSVARNSFRITREEISDIRAAITELKEKLGERTSEAKSIRSSIVSIRNELPMDPNIAEQRAKELDWKIQTTSLGAKEEKELVDEIRYLESQSIKGNKIKSLSEKLTQVRTEIESAEIRLNGLRKRLGEQKSKRNEFYSAIMKHSAELSALQSKVDQVYQSLIETKMKSGEIHQDYTQLATKRKELTVNLKEIKEKIVITEFEKQAIEKLRTGRKLTLEEYKFLIEKDLLKSQE